MNRLKKYKAFFTDKEGKELNSKIIYANDQNEAQERADNIMSDMNDKNIIKATVTYIEAGASSWSGIYR